MTVTDITLVLHGVIIIAVGLITCFLVPFIRSKLTAEQRARLSGLVNTLVKAAEMLFPDKGQGKAKTEYVKEYLEKAGYTVDAATLEATIEAAVCELNKGKAESVVITVEDGDIYDNQ